MVFYVLLPTYCTVLHLTIHAHFPNVSDFAVFDIRPHHISKLHVKCPFAVHYISKCTQNAVFADCGKLSFLLTLLDADGETPKMQLCISFAWHRTRAPTLLPP